MRLAQPADKIDSWGLLGAIDQDERALAVSLLDDAPPIVQLMRAAGLTWRDIRFDPCIDVVRAGFALVEVPASLTLPDSQRWNLMRRLAIELSKESQRGDSCAREIDEMARASRPHRRAVVAVIGRLARIARASRIADQHFAAYRRAMLAASRVATEGRDERLQARADVDRTVRLLAEQKRRVPPARDVRTVGPGARLAGRIDPRGGDRERRAGRVDATHAEGGARRQAG